MVFYNIFSSIFISTSRIARRLLHMLYSSPLRRIFLFYYQMVQNCMPLKHFRPLFGVSLFLLFLVVLLDRDPLVFVPSTGCLYFYKTEITFMLQETISFRPLYGVSLFLPFLVFPLKTQRELSGLRGKCTNQIISCSQIPVQSFKCYILQASAQNHNFWYSIRPIPISYSSPRYLVHLHTCGAIFSPRSFVCLCFP